MSIGYNHLSVCGIKSPRRRPLHEGRTKVLFGGPEDGSLVLYFKDICKKHKDLVVSGKGSINHRISEIFMSRLNDIGVATHFIKRLNMHEQLIKEADPLPFSVTVSNIAVGSFAERLGLENGVLLKTPVIEFDIKKDNPSSLQTFISEYHILSLDLASEDELEGIKEIVGRINDFMRGQCVALGLNLAKIKMEFGRAFVSEYEDETQIIIIDELNVDNCTMIDQVSGVVFDVDLLPDDVTSDASEQRKMYHNLARRFGIIKGETNEIAGADQTAPIPIENKTEEADADLS